MNTTLLPTDIVGGTFWLLSMAMIGATIFFLLERNKVDEVLIAMPSVAKSTLRNLLNEIEKFSIKVRILPGVEELAQGKVLVSELKEVDINDLLGREEVNADQNLIQKITFRRNFLDKAILAIRNVRTPFSIESNVYIFTKETTTSPFSTELTLKFQETNTKRY